MSAMDLHQDDTPDTEDRPAVALEIVRSCDHDEAEALMPNPEAAKPEVFTPQLHPTTGALLTAATYSIDDSAFATWREQLNSALHEQSSALQTQVLELQRAFEGASQYIRGDFAWRKQIAAFHDRTNDAVASALQQLNERLQQSTQTLSASLDETLKIKDMLAKEEMQRQVCMYEDKLRRSRIALKKEIDRFTHLEKCLRKEETRQAKATYDRLVQQLTLEHAAKEATLQAMLRGLKISYLTIENANTQLIEAVKGKDDEIERLKKLLPKVNGGVVRGNTVLRPGSGTTAAALAASDAYVQSLKQSLHSANATIDSLRKQADETTADKESTQKKLRLADEAATKTNDELSKVKHLLSESHAALLANRKEVETLLQEKTHWKDLYAELHFQSGIHEQALDDAKRLAEVAQGRVESLEKQRHRRLDATDEAMLMQLREHWTRRHDAKDALEIVDALLTRATADHRTDTSEAETKVRFAFERKYGDMLNVRIHHERKRVLARIEMLWHKRVDDAPCSTAKPTGLAAKEVRRQNPGRDTTTRGASLKQMLQLVTEAFEDLGFSDWASTDIDMLQEEITTLRDALRSQQKRYDELQRHAEEQTVTLTRTELHGREKEMLLAELIDRYRVLRAHTERLQEAQNTGNDAPAPLDLSQWDTTDPFTVYGHQHVIEEKKRPGRARPVSASATLSGGGDPMARVTPRPATSVSANGARRHTSLAPKTFLLSQLPEVIPGNGSVVSTPLQQREDHVRSVLKADLLSLTPAENQQDDGSHVGTDGILQILQRRRHRK